MDQTIKKKGGIRLLTLLMVFVIAVTAVINCVCVYNVFGGSPEDYMRADDLTSDQERVRSAREEEVKQTSQALENGKMSYVSAGLSSGQSTQITVDDLYDAYDALSYVGIDTSIYSCTKMVSNTKNNIYDMQQSYNGVEVYGYMFKVTTDMDGNLVSIFGDRAFFDDDFTVDCDYDEYDCRDTLREYLMDEYELTEDELDDYDRVQITGLGKKIVFLEEEPYVGFFFDVTTAIEDVYLCNRIIVDAKENEVIADNPKLHNDMITVDYEGQLSDQTFDVYKYSDKKYVLKDIDRKIAVTYFGDESEISWDPKSAVPSKNEVDALANVQKIYDCYEEMFEREGITGDYINVQLDYPHYGDDNAAMTFDGKYMFISPNNKCSSTRSAFLDIIGHEYTHGIIGVDSTLNDYSHSGKTDYTQQGAINEGIADVMGEVMEDYESDRKLNDTNDWIHTAGSYDDGSVNRDLRDPSKSRGTQYISYRDYTFEKVECHEGSTIISHAAYLMNNGVNGADEPLSMENIANLFYYIIPQLTGTTGYGHLRYYLENEAILMNKDYHEGTHTYTDSSLTDEQLETVMDALDSVFIPRYIYEDSYDLFRSITPDCELTVYDHNDKVVDKYQLRIERLSDGETVFDKEIKGSSYTLSGVEPGYYKMYFIDPENENAITTVKAWINDNSVYPDGDRDRYAEKSDIYTHFNSPERDVVLVLDNSGSMSGTPLSETKTAAVKFVDYVFNENPSIMVSLVSYSDYATTRVERSSDKNELISAINGLYASGGTNMYDAMETAQLILSESPSDKRLMIVMSDGLPCVGPYDDYSDYDSPIIRLSEEIKKEGMTIYSLGFFHNLSGSELTQGENLMETIASEGYAYNVSDSDELGYAFEEMADYVGGSYAILIRIACPVEVTVSYNGEVLSSSDSKRNTRASFGSLSFEGEDDEVKVLRLSDAANYELFINGTGSGTMDYTISFADEDGEYSDVRTFKKVPINRDTLISTSTSKTGHTTLSVDKDGDGRIDETYSAGKNRKGKVKDFNIWLYVAIGSGALLLILLAVEIVLIIKRAKKNKFCHSCGQSISKETVYCRTCGTEVHRVPLLLPDRTGRKKQSPTAIVAKLVVMGICILSSVGVIAVYRSAATTVFKQIRNQELMMAETVYEEHIENTWLPQKYLSFATEHYLKKVEKAREKGEFGDGTADSVYNAVSEMEMGKASSTADEYIGKMSTDGSEEA